MKASNVGAVDLGTVTNYGTIEATAAGGYSVKVEGPAATLQVEAGSKLIGLVAGNAGTLEFADGKGVISRIGGGTILAGGAKYLNFGTLSVDSGAAFTTTGVGLIASSGVAAIDVMGTIDVAGTLNVSGTLFNSGFFAYGAGHLAGAGLVEFLAGTSTIGRGVDLTTAHVLVSGAHTVIDISSNTSGWAATVTGAWEQTAGSVYVSYQDLLKLTGAGDSLSGTLKGGGTVSLTGAGDTLSAITLSAGKTAIAAASGTLSGIIDVVSVLTVASPDLQISGATQFTGGGLVQLTQSATTQIGGATAGSTLLENSDRIEGGGRLGGGQLLLTNDTGGTILAIGNVGMVIDTGTHAVANAGLIESAGAGGLVIDSAVANTGLMETRGGNLTVDGAVTGAGAVTVDGGTASFAGAFNENVAFIFKGELALAHSQAYTATISGFSKSGATSLDLEDISFTAASATYSGTTTSGVLTVTDGTHTAKLDIRRQLPRLDLGSQQRRRWRGDGHRPAGRLGARPDQRHRRLRAGGGVERRPQRADPGDRSAVVSRAWRLAGDQQSEHKSDGGRDAHRLPGIFRHPVAGLVAEVAGLVGGLAVEVLRLAGGLIELATNLSGGIAERGAEGVLHASGGLFGRALDAIFVHGDLLGAKLLTR